MCSAIKTYIGLPLAFALALRLKLRVNVSTEIGIWHGHASTITYWSIFFLANLWCSIPPWVGQEVFEELAIFCVNGTKTRIRNKFLLLWFFHLWRHIQYRVFISYVWAKEYGLSHALIVCCQCCRFPVSHIHMELVISHLLPNTLDLNHPDSPTCRVYLSFDADWLQLAVDQPFDKDIHVVTRMDPPAIVKLPRRQSVLDVHITAERGPLTG